jgi:hypothetical protein
MTYFSFKKKKVTTKCSGGERKWLPLPIPPLDCNEPEGHSLPVDISLPPLHILPQLKQPSPRGELRVTSSQTISVGEKDAVPLSPKMVKVLGADGREEAIATLGFRFIQLCPLCITTERINLRSCPDAAVAVLKSKGM